MGSGFTGPWDGLRPAVHRPADQEAAEALAVKHEGRWDIVRVTEANFIAVERLRNCPPGSIVMARTVQELESQLEER